MDDIQILGGNIELHGFRDLDGGSMVILKKIVGLHARNLLNNNKVFDKLSLKLNKMVLTGTNENNVFALQVDLVSGETIVSKEVEHNNLFFALNDLLKQL